MDAPPDVPAAPPRPDAAPPLGGAGALFDTDLVTPATRGALRARLAEPADDAVTPRALGAAAWATLRAAAARLIPQPAGASRGAPVPLAAPVDARLASGSGNGWRYDALPPDPDARRRGLAGLDEAARALGGDDFVALALRTADRFVAALARGGAGLAAGAA